MSGTLFFTDGLGTPAGLALSLAIGILFGFFLDKAGFGSSRRLTGIFYFRDMSVLKVMFTAVVTCMVGFQYLKAAGWVRAEELYALDTFWGAQIIGGLVFGAGFVIGGWCPGTAFVGLANLKIDALVFLLGATLGSILFNEVFEWVLPLYSATAGTLDLSASLGVAMPLVVIAFCVAAVLAFAGSTLLEKHIGGLPALTAPVKARNRMAAAALVVLALGTFLLPEPGPSASTAAQDSLEGAPQASGLLTEVESAADHIEPMALAVRLMSGEKGLVIVDVRPGSDYAKFHIRGAVSIPLPELAARAQTELPRTGTVVLYSNGTTHPAQAWLLLRQAGWSNGLVLTDGLLAFWRQCLTPPSLREGGDPVTVAAASAAFAARRAYFLEGKDLKRPDPPVAPIVAGGLATRLVSTEWLAARLTNENVKILDVRAKSTSYTGGHIPGALYLNGEQIRSTVDGIPSMVVPADEIAVILGRLGIRPTDTVIVYSDAFRDATLVGMALDRVGHASWAILNGGFDPWKAEKRPLITAFPAVVPQTYEAKAGADTFTVDIDDVKAALSDGRTQILDTRPADYFSGEKSEEARAGHIPGAVNREFKKDLVPGKEILQDEQRLREAYSKLGMDGAKPVIVQCRTGHQASQTYFVLKYVLGLPDVRWFDASWSAWAAREDLPIVK